MKVNFVLLNNEKLGKAKIVLIKAVCYQRFAKDLFDPKSTYVCSKIAMQVYFHNKLKTYAYISVTGGGDLLRNRSLLIKLTFLVKLIQRSYYIIILYLPLNCLSFLTFL